MRPTQAIIDLSALRHNLDIVRTIASGIPICAVVKAEAYGHGLLRISQELQSLGIDCLGVGFLEEAIVLRENGIKTPILVLGGLVDEQVDDYLKWDVEATISSVWKARVMQTAAENAGVVAPVHIKIDTGLGRVGQQWDSVDRMIMGIKDLPNLFVKGIYTHFASSDSEDPTLTRQQIERFKYALEMFRSQGINPPLTHTAGSGALLQFAEETLFSMVRPGLMLYGYAPSYHLQNKRLLQPVMTLRSSVVYVKKPHKGVTIGYGATWETDGERWIATIPIGYGDGFPKRAGEKGVKVLVNNKLCPIVGRVAMDQIMVDAGNEVYLNREAILFGKSDSGELSLWELCNAIDAIPYEILCGITSRVPRIYVDKTKTKRETK